MVPRPSCAAPTPRWKGRRLQGLFAHTAHDAAVATRLSGEPQLTLMLTAGGDERIALDPATRRNRYGVTPTPAETEIFFSSSTASAPTRRGFEAALADWRALGAGLPLPDWFETLRARIRDAYGTPDCEVVLAPSGTETEYLALVAALAAAPGPLTNLVVAPQETGRGVLLAAHGAHFLPTAPFQGDVTPGERIAGFDAADIRVETIEIRDASGALRPTEDVAETALRAARRALAGGRSVLAHYLAVSKTGRTGLDLEAIDAIHALAPDRVTIVADCCQLRTTPEQIRALLRRGFLVAITGSKFAGGPPFCGALLLPASLCARFGAFTAPSGLAGHSSRLDWPDRLREQLNIASCNDANLGLGLRWSAALPEIERFVATPRTEALRAQARFRREVGALAGECDALLAIPDEPGVEDFSGTIAPVKIYGVDGHFLDEADLQVIRRAMLAPLPGVSAILQRPIHLGQPVPMGAGAGLRFCMSAPMIADLCEKLTAGVAFETAFAPIAADLRLAFEKLHLILSQEQRGEA